MVAIEMPQMIQKLRVYPTAEAGALALMKELLSEICDRIENKQPAKFTRKRLFEIMVYEIDNHWEALGVPKGKFREQLVRDEMDEVYQAFLRLNA